VLIIAGYFDIFCGYQEISLAKELAKKSCDVYVISSSLTNPIFSLDMLRKIGLKSRRYPVGHTHYDGYVIIRDKSIFECRAMVWTKNIFKIIKDIDPALVIAPYTGQLLPIAAGIIKKKCNYSLITIFGDNHARTSHLSKPLRYIKNILFMLSKGFLYRYNCKQSDRILINTEESKNILNLYIRKIDNKKVEMFPLGFDKETFFFDQNLRGIGRQEFGIKDECVLISVGKIVKEKEYEILLNIFRSMSREGLNFKVLLVGFDNSPYAKKINYDISDDDILKNVVFALPFSSHNQLNKYYNLSDIAIWHKQPAISIQQGMGTGIDVIIPFTQCVNHLINNSTRGTFFKYKNYRELQSVLEKKLKKYEYSEKERLLRQKMNMELSFSNLVNKIEDNMC
jgi:glycosyltransferase involved in cell wall biosynthesis